MGLTTIIWGRQGGKNALREWATNVWQDWQAGHVIEYWIPGAEYPVCPVCWHRYRLVEIDDKIFDSARRLYVLIMAAPAMDGPLDPGGWRKAEGCRCWRGYSHSASLHSE